MICFDIDSSGKILQAARMHAIYTTQQNKDGTTTQVLDTSKLPAWTTNHFDDSDVDAAKALYDTEHYTYVNNAWVYTAPTNAEQFVSAQSAKKASIQQSFGNAIAAGFPSKADGTQRTYPIDSLAMAKWTGILAIINSGNGPASFKVRDVTGAKVTLTADQFKQFSLDGFAYYNKYEQMSLDKPDQIDTCKTTSQLDTIGFPNPNPPSAPTGLTVTAGSVEATLTWTANTDVTMIDGGGYNVYQDGTKVNPSLVTSETYTATGLTSGTQYSFSITAVDTDGNESTQCIAVTVTPN